MNLQLDDKTARITGVSVGIGRGIALALAAEGVRIAVSARRVDKLGELAEEIVAKGGHRPVVITADLYEEDAAKKLAAAAISGLGRVDILVNNAGGSRSFKDLHVSEDQCQEAMTLNFHRPRQVPDALIDHMIAHQWAELSTSPARASQNTPTARSVPKQAFIAGPRVCRAWWASMASPSIVCRPDAFIPNRFSAITRLNTGSGNAKTKFLSVATASQKTWPT